MSISSGSMPSSKPSTIVTSPSTRAIGCVSFAVGPAARHTDQGIIGSNQVRGGRILPIDDWAGRGGLGSRLLQRHRIAACIFGGDWEDPDLKDSKEIDGYFLANYGQPMIKVDLGAGEKYRYVPGFQTGGTFGVNMHTVDARLFSFNWSFGASA